MDSFGLIRKLNLEYARLLRDILRRHESFTRERLSWGETQVLAGDDTTIAVPTRWGFISSFPECVPKCSCRRPNLLGKYGHEYGMAAREAEGLKLSLAVHPSPSLFLYFDAVVLQDGLPGCGHPDLDNRSLIACTLVRANSMLLPLLEAQSDIPMVVLKPASETTLLQPDWTKEFRKQQDQRSSQSSY